MLLKERSAVAGRHSLICHYSHQAPGTAALKLCVRVFVRAVRLIGILVAGWGKAESPWRPGAKEKRRWERTRKTIWWDKMKDIGRGQNKIKAK